MRCEVRKARERVTDNSQPRGNDGKFTSRPRSIRVQTRRGRPAKITRQRVEELCKVLMTGGDLVLACDLIQVSRNTPRIWAEKGKEIEELAEEEVAAGGNPIITQEDKLYLEFLCSARQASARFQMRHLNIMNLAGGQVDPATGQFKLGDWRSSWALLRSKYPKRFVEPKEIPFEADRIGLDDMESGASVLAVDADRLDVLQYVYETEILPDRSGNGVEKKEAQDIGSGNGKPPDADDIL